MTNNHRPRMSIDTKEIADRIAADYIRWRAAHKAKRTGSKGTHPQSFADAEAEAAMRAAQAEFLSILDNIIADDTLSRQDKSRLVTQAADDLAQRLSGSAPAAGQKSFASSSAAAPYVAQLFRHSGAQQAWRELGLTADDVAAHMQRTDWPEGVGVTPGRLSQLLGDPSAANQARILNAMTDAALDRGRSKKEVRNALTKALGGERERSAKKYVDDLLGRGR